MAEAWVPNHKRRSDSHEFMSATQEFPSFDLHLADLNQFILQLVEAYRAEKIKSWHDLEIDVKTYFTPERMEQIDSVAPGWRKMTSYLGGVTLVHVMRVFLGLFIMPKFLRMTREQQQMMKWAILFHDIEKEPQEEKRDTLHAFRSAVAAARTLPKLGFAVTADFNSLIDGWEEYTRSAITNPKDSADTIQDNRKLPTILDGIERMFGQRTPASLIIKTVLFHLSVNMNAWPPAAPLTDEQVGSFFDEDLVILLRAMHLGDGEGWNMFEPYREYLRNDTLEAFRTVKRLISS